MEPFTTSADKPPVAYSSRALIRDLWRFLGPYRLRFLSATTVRVISDLAWLYPAFALASIVTFFSTYRPGDNVGSVYLLLGVWVVISIIHYGGHFLAQYLGFPISERVALDAELKTLKHLFLLDVTWHERDNAGNKLKKIMKGGEGIDKTLRMWIMNILEISVNFVAMTSILAGIHFEIASAVFAFLASFLWMGIVMVKRAAVASHVVNVKEEDVHGLAFESINNIRTVKVMSMIRPLSELLGREIKDLFGKIKRRIFLYQSRGLILNLWAQAFRLGMVAYIVIGIAHGRFEVGFIVLFYSYFNKIWESASELATVAQDFAIAKYGIARMVEVLQEPVCTDDETGKVPLPARWKTISFRDVSFAYSGKNVLEHVSFDIRRGERIGIVGISGAGKSTLFKLLLKEHENYSGEILFDGVPLRSISKIDYLGRAAVVLQDTEVFNFSLRDNIVMSNIEKEKDARLFKKALDVSHVSDFIDKLPKGTGTFIGEKGFKLSGGERQRLGIARAIFKNPEILFLDEATSHLDLESEEKIQDSLHRFFGAVTAVVIAHRLTTIREMDRILVVEDGCLIEEGGFAKLMRKRGRFAELWKKQKL